MLSKKIKKIKVQLHLPNDESSTMKIQETTNHYYIYRVNQQLRNSTLTGEEKKAVIEDLIKAMNKL